MDVPSAPLGATAQAGPVSTVPAGRPSGDAVAVRMLALGLGRPTEDRLVSGVASGIAARLGVDVGVVRLAFVVLATAGGVGVVLYALGRALMPEVSGAPAGARLAVGRRSLGFTLIVAGVLLLCRGMGAWIADALTWPVALASLGSALVWTRAAEEERLVWRSALERAVGQRAMPNLQSIGRIRLAIGVILAIAGLLAFLLTTDLSAAPDVLLASFVTVIGMALVVGPWLQGMATQVTSERRERIRSEERADMAAHLHDSVLQTLALIQRASTPEEMTRLARGQERELRAWLFGRRPDDAPTMLGEAIRDVAGRVEDRYGVTVEVVAAGDLPLDDDLRALVDATAEAMANAGRHAEVAGIDVFVEVDDDAAHVFVRDEGRGFDPNDLPADRRGVSESLHGRMRRHGGTAVITSEPGAGTEVELHLPRMSTGPAVRSHEAEATANDPPPNDPPSNHPPPNDPPTTPTSPTSPER